MSEQEFEEPPIRFTDNRKIDRQGETAGADPVTGSAPQASESDALETETESDALGRFGGDDANAQLLEERTRDLQRLSAEYANYRKRAERERLAAGDIAVSRVLTDLLPVVDDLDRARAHGDLSGALKAVADKLDAVFAKLGLVPFGEAGEPFDPSVHEAVLHDESEEVEVPTASTIMRVGFRHGERLIRPAMVGVTAPSNPAPSNQGPTNQEPVESGADEAAHTAESDD